MDNPTTRLDGRVALVAGGGRGIGEKSSLILARAGADLAIVDLDEDRAKAVVDKVESLGRNALSVVADVTDSQQINSMVTTVLDRFGQIDIVVNVVGMPSWDSAFEMSEKVWDTDMMLNLKYVWLCSRAVAKVMAQQGRKGSIINIGSAAGLVAAPHHAAYGAAKAGLVSLTKSLAEEWAPCYIRVNTIAPCGIRTPRVAEMFEAVPEHEESQKGEIPLGRWGEPEDIAGGVLFLASDLSDYVTGHTIPYDGGVLLNPLRASKYNKVGDWFSVHRSDWTRR